VGVKKLCKTKIKNVRDLGSSGRSSYRKHESTRVNSELKNDPKLRNHVTDERRTKRSFLVSDRCPNYFLFRIIPKNLLPLRKILCKSPDKIARCTHEIDVASMEIQSGMQTSKTCADYGFVWIRIRSN